MFIVVWWQAVRALAAHERDVVTSMQSHYEQLKKTVLQRLKWAAGANPSLAQTLIQFEEALAVDQALLEVGYHVQSYTYVTYTKRQLSFSR